MKKKKTHLKSLLCVFFDQLVMCAVQMTEKVTSHPKNLEAVSHAMQEVFASEVFMSAMRRVLKHILLDREIQRIVGVSLAGISKETVKSTFSWNPNQAEESRQALLRSDGSDDDSSAPAAPASANADRPNPLGQWIRGVQMALDPQRRQLQQQEEQERQSKQRSLRGANENQGQGSEVSASGFNEEKKASVFNESRGASVSPMCAEGGLLIANRDSPKAKSEPELTNS